MPRSHRRRFAAARTAARAAVVAAPFVLPAALARGSVILSFTDSDATPTSTIVTAGSTFSVTLNLTSTSEQTTGLDYFLRDNTFASVTRFRITDRNIGASTFSDTFFADAIVEAQPSSNLDGDNNNDLGASLANVNVPNGANTFLVATYTFLVPSTTPASPVGSPYTISTFSPAGQGYQAAGPLFTDTPFNQHATFSVTVLAVPEPGAFAITALGALWLAGRRRTARAA